jgi:hypothetical protein
MVNIYVITGASQNHFKSLKQFISTVDTSLCKCIVWDLGLNETSILELNSMFNITYRKFDYTKYPEYYNININAGEYAWKPAIIKESMDEIISSGIINDDIILWWCDAGNKHDINSLSKIKNLVIHNKIYSPLSSGTIKKWTHIKTLEYFKISLDDPILDKPPRNGAILGFLISDNDVRNFIDEFAICGKTKESIAPKGSDRTNHRQDQAVFTILYYNFF